MPLFRVFAPRAVSALGSPRSVSENPEGLPQMAGEV